MGDEVEPEGGGSGHHGGVPGPRLDASRHVLDRPRGRLPTEHWSRLVVCLHTPEVRDFDATDACLDTECAGYRLELSLTTTSKPQVTCSSAAGSPEMSPSSRSTAVLAMPSLSGRTDVRDGV